MTEVIPFFNIILGNQWLFIFVPAYLILTAFYYFWQNTSRLCGEGSYFYEGVPIRWLKRFFIILLAVLILRAVSLTILQYILWQAGPLGVYFLPPYQPITYFLGYSFIHFFASLFLTIVATASVVVIFVFFQKLRGMKDGRELWVRGEEYIFLAGAFLLRWPLMIPYLFLGILVSIGYLVAVNCFLRRGNMFFINIMPFFAILVLPLLLFKNFVINFFLLKSLLMPM